MTINSTVEEVGGVLKRNKIKNNVINIYFNCDDYSYRGSSQNIRKYNVNIMWIVTRKIYYNIYIIIF